MGAYTDFLSAAATGQFDPLGDVFKHINEARRYQQAREAQQAQLAEHQRQFNSMLPIHQASADATLSNAQVNASGLDLKRQQAAGKEGEAKTKFQRQAALAVMKNQQGDLPTTLGNVTNEGLNLDEADLRPHIQQGVEIKTKRDIATQGAKDTKKAGLRLGVGKALNSQRKDLALELAKDRLPIDIAKGQALAGLTQTVIAQHAGARLEKQKNEAHANMDKIFDELARQGEQVNAGLNSAKEKIMYGNSKEGLFQSTALPASGVSYPALLNEATLIIGQLNHNGNPTKYDEDLVRGKKAFGLLRVGGGLNPTPGTYLDPAKLAAARKKMHEEIDAKVDKLSFLKKADLPEDSSNEGD